MGRASSVAFMPTSSMSGGSLAPMENSPPGIHTIPAGGKFGALDGLEIVGPNIAAAGEGGGAPALAVSVTRRERINRTDNAVTSTATMRSRIHVFAFDCGLAVDAVCGGFLSRVRFVDMAW